MNEMIKKREVRKKYWAIVREQPPKQEETLIHQLIRDRQKNKSFVSGGKNRNSKEAILTYRLISQSKDYFLLEVDLQTGRHHQIRVQLAHIGCPIKGDLKYGYSRSNKDASISLHARSISFLHPVRKEEIEVVASPPDDILWNFFAEKVQE
jgi:23S rRNA pseudouridine1911/1915/1917 synthase